MILETFGSLCWSRQEDKVAYIAEKKLPKTAPFYEQKKTNVENDKNETGMVKIISVLSNFIT